MEIFYSALFYIFFYFIELIYPKCSYARQRDNSNLIRLPVIFDPGPYSLLDAVTE